MPGETGVTCGDYACMLILFCMRGCGCIERPAFPAPFDCRGPNERQHLAQKSMRRECGNMSHRRCERSEAIHLSACCAMDCFAALAMTNSLVITRFKRVIQYSGGGRDWNREATAYWVARSRPGDDRRMQVGATRRLIRPETPPSPPLSQPSRRPGSSP